MECQNLLHTPKSQNDGARVASMSETSNFKTKPLQYAVCIHPLGQAQLCTLIFTLTSCLSAIKHCSRKLTILNEIDTGI